MGFLDRIFNSKQTTVPSANSHAGHTHLSCAACGGQFHSRTELEAHGKAHHAPPAQFKCGACGGVFPTKSALEAHAKNDHGM